MVGSGWQASGGRGPKGFFFKNFPVRRLRPPVEKGVATVGKNVAGIRIKTWLEGGFRLAGTWLNLVKNRKVGLKKTGKKLVKNEVKKWLKNG